MIGAVSSPGFAVPMPLSPRLVLDAWRGITVTHVWVTFLLGTGYFVYHASLWFGGTYHGLGWPLFFILRQASAFALLLCVVVADRVTGKDPQRRAAYAVSVLVGSAVGGIVVPLVLDLFRSNPLPIEVTLYVHFFELVLLGGAAVFIYIDRRSAQAALARMQAAELGRLEDSKRMLESRLQAMQARVEPQFLFNTLAQVKRLYEHDAERAERVLDELIAYLRAAMPRMRDTSSTVGREIDLVRAFLAIVRIRMDDRLGFSIDLPAEVVDAKLPPMMLLPLVDQLVVQRWGPAQPDGVVRIAIALDHGLLRLTVVCPIAIASDDEEAIASLRERLAALYGDQAKLALRPTADRGTEVSLEIPHELPALPVATVSDDSDRNACSAPASSGSTRAGAAPTPARNAS